MVVTLACLALTFIISHFLDKSIFQLSVVAVVLSAWYGGLAPGLLSALLSSVGTAFFILEPQFSLAVASMGDALNLSVFVLVSILMSVLSETRHRSEQVLFERTAELEAANKELEAFSYSVSHDLRSPLRIIDNYARLSLEAQGLPASISGAQKAIRMTVQEMDELVNGLLDFARLGRQAINVHEINVTNLVNSVLEGLRDEQAGRQIKITVADMPHCKADPTLLRVVFTNLLHNAMKFTRQREDASIEVGTLTGAAPIYYVKDNGVGFDMQYAPQLFDIFKRLHQDEAIEGSGIGLAIVQRIIQRHGGRVWAEAVKGEGAVFYFTLSKGDGHD